MKRTNFKVPLFSLVLLVCLMFTAYAHADSSAMGCTAYVSADTKLNLRSEPQGDIIGKLPKGEKVTILSERDRNGYYRIYVHRDNMICYAYGEYLTIEYNTGNYVPVTPPVWEDNYYQEDNWNDDYYEYEELDGWEDEILVVVSEKKLNLRKKPSRNAGRIVYLKYGDRLRVVSTKVKNNYVLVKDLANGKLGYVDIDYVVLESTYMKTKQCCKDNNCGCLKR